MLSDNSTPHTHESNSPPVSQQKWRINCGACGLESLLPQHLAKRTWCTHAESACSCMLCLCADLVVKKRLSRRSRLTQTPRRRAPKLISQKQFIMRWKLNWCCTRSQTRRILSKLRPSEGPLCFWALLVLLIIECIQAWGEIYGHPSLFIDGHIKVKATLFIDGCLIIPFLDWYAECRRVDTGKVLFTKADFIFISLLRNQFVFAPYWMFLLSHAQRNI
jgi:hypothetical protein